MEGPKPANARATTDARGLAAMDGVAAGSWLLLAGAPGLAGDRREFSVVEGERRERLRLVLLPAHALGGRVLWSDGRPAAGTIVRAVQANDWRETDAPAVRAGTDGEGRFRLEGLRPGHQVLSVEPRPGLAESAGVVQVPGVTTVEIRLLPRATFAGRVLDGATGEGVEGARVKAELRWSGSDGGQAVLRALSGPGGKFEIQDAPAGILTSLEVGATGYLAYPDAGAPAFEEGPPIPPGARREVEVRLGRGAVVRGTVRDRAGAPVPHAWVEVSVESPELGSLAAPMAWCDERGAFVVRGANAGTACIYGGAWGLHSENSPVQTFRLPAGREVVEDVVLVPDGTIEGRVVFADGTPAAGFVPRLGPEQDRSWRGWEGASSGADGGFRIEQVATVGPQVVRVLGPGGKQGRSDPFLLEAGEAKKGVLVVLREGGSLAGVVRREDGRPPAGALLYVLPVAEDAGEPEVSRNQTWTAVATPVDAGGAFRAEGLPAGRHTVLCTAPGCGTVTGPALDLQPGEDRRDLEIVLPPEQVIAGRVVLPGGDPVEGARVSLWREAAPVLSGGWGAAVTGADGRFRVGGLVSGEYQVTASRRPYLDVMEAADAGREDVEIVLQAPLAISGRVLEEGTGAAVAGLPVRASSAGGWQAGVWDPESTAETARDGSFTLEGLREGTYEVAVGEPSRIRPTSHVPAVKEGVAAGAKEVVFRLRKGLAIVGRVVDGEGRPVPRDAAHVKIRRAGLLEWEPETCGTKEDGGFGFFGLEAGKYGLVVNPGSDEDGQESPWVQAVLEDVEAGNESVVVRLRKGLTISGRVAGGELEGGIRVCVSGTGRPALEDRWIGTGEEWAFETPALDAGTSYDLFFQSQGGEFRAAARKVPAGATGVVLRPEARPAAIAGTVVDPEGKPVLGITVEAAATDGSEDSVEVETDATGAFAFQGLLPVRYRLTAGGLGTDYAWPETEPVVPPGESRAVLRLRRGHVLRGTLKDADGTPLEALLVVGIDRGGRLHESMHPTDASDGSFELKGLPAGKVVLKLQRYGATMGNASPLGTYEVPSLTLALNAH